MQKLIFFRYLRVYRCTNVIPDCLIIGDNVKRLRDFENRGRKKF